MTCINSLVNMSCNDPPPLSTNCFICGQVVESFKAPFGINVLSPSSDDGKIPKDPIQPVDFTDNLASITGNSGQSLEDGSWFPSSFRNKKSKLTTRNFVSYLEHGPAPIFCDKWPVVRVDNIAWGQTIEGILRWLPSLDVLPPSNLCPLPIHILCNAADGKTLNYCFIETRDIASAHLLVRQRQATKIDSRPCSVGLTSLKELHANLSSSFPRGVIRTAEDLLRLCDTSVVQTLKAPERPFLHLVSIVLQYPSVFGIDFLPPPLAVGQVDENPEEALARQRIREIYLLAIQNLLRAHSWVPNHSKIVKIMLEAGFFSTRSFA
ncbi:hypothetical protein CROQUDRAFT_223773 [Cronartium quercuum f. sp. fusiforme G11]|uniref:Uncharacterized protein n=1 Tax=Cronartium quercuum f. sp. fusiforme G11 TaxID=708437 RepID=A0A9P6NED6_9BASI|nr:hypothetical protein CROQUDRAFT_223773 [Cronartium quercuum f. sp. fusiforme G11]